MVVCVSFVCRRLRGIANTPYLWRFSRLTGPVRWLTALECAAYERRALQFLECGISAAPHACTSIMLACCASLLCTTLWLPPRARWLTSIAEVLDTLQHRCLSLRSLHLRNAAHLQSEELREAEEPEWPEHAVVALEALLRTRRLRNLSLKFAAIPVPALAALSDAAGESLRALRFLPESDEQLHSAPLLAHALTGLRLFGTSWHLMPRLLPTFLAGAPALASLECQWVRSWDLPHALVRGDRAALVAHLARAPEEPEEHAAPAQAVDELSEDPLPGELDACLLAIAHVLARCTAAACTADSDALPAARPFTVIPHCARHLSPAGIAAAQRVYPALTVNAGEDAYENEENYV